MAEPTLDEFQRIARFFAPLAGPGALGLKDDCALIDGPAGTQYVLKTDSIVENIHFFPDDPPSRIAQKLLRVNLSDLAAKGARPVGYLLAIALPTSRNEAWLEAFSQGLAEDQKRYGITLLGGDSDRTDGPVTLTAMVIGTVDSGMALLRSGARAGDVLYVSGTLGDAAVGLKVLRGSLASLSRGHRQYLIDRYRLPQPRMELGPKLIGLASAAMDISDGLVADLGHLCDASGVAAVIEAGRLPLSEAVGAALTYDPSLISAILGGGDDYEILFTAPDSATATLVEASHQTGIDITAIGQIEAGKGVTVLDSAGKRMSIEIAGYRHF